MAETRDNSSAAAGAGQELVVGGIPLRDVMRQLAALRPVFHSEADLQFGFAQRIEAMSGGAVASRLEVPQSQATSRRATYLDLLCRSPLGDVAIEFKYFTRGWSGEVRGEHFWLKNHAATDLARLHFVHDIARSEALTTATRCQGIALILTNERGFWQVPRGGARRGNDAEFSLHEGYTLAGARLWGNGYAANTRHLRGRYAATWNDYSQPDPGAKGGTLRWLAFAVEPVKGEAAISEL